MGDANLRVGRVPEAQIARLAAVVETNVWFMAVLDTVHRVLPGGYVGAGVLRDVVWDHLEGRREFLGCSDIDVAHFDPSDLSPERDHEIERALRGIIPDAPWEVTNQAGVHLWFERYFGYAVEPLTSMEDAVATWPEFATATAVRRARERKLDVLASFGLDDLFGMVVRRNPRRVSRDVYRRRLRTKRYAERWPSVTIVDD